ncbi:hypothetical protein Tco_0174662 [Tanacetum coccineum]
MGDETPIRTLEDYSKPSHEGYRNTIELPVGNNVNIIPTSSSIPGTRLEPRSDKESPKVEITNDEEVEITNVVIPVNVNEEEEEITDEVKSFDTLADHLQEVMVKSLPTMVDTHIKEQVKKQVPEQVQDQVPVYVVEGLILERQKTKEEMEQMIAKAIYKSAGIYKMKFPHKFRKLLIIRSLLKLVCQPSSVRPRDQDDPHDDAHPEGENRVKRQKTYAVSPPDERDTADLPKLVTFCNELGNGIIMANLPPNHNEFAPAAEAAPDNMNVEDAMLRLRPRLEVAPIPTSYSCYTSPRGVTVVTGRLNTIMRSSLNTKSDRIIRHPSNRFHHDPEDLTPDQLGVILCTSSSDWRSLIMRQWHSPIERCLLRFKTSTTTPTYQEAPYVLPSAFKVPVLIMIPGSNIAARNAATKLLY